MGRQRHTAEPGGSQPGRRANLSGSVYPIRSSGRIIGFLADVPWGRGQGSERVKRRVALGERTEAQAKAEAERLRLELVAARDAGLSADAYRLTVGQLLAAYLRAIEGKQAPGTVKNKRIVGELYISPTIEHLRLGLLDAKTVSRLLGRLERDEAPSVGLAAWYLISAAVKWAHREGMIASIAWLLDVRRPEYTPRTRIDLNDEQVQRLHTSALLRPDAALWIIAVDRGIRSAELRGLTWPDVDWSSDQPRLRIARQAQPVKGGMGLTPRLKTKNSYRNVPLDLWHVELLQGARKHVEQLRKLAGDGWHEMGLIFPSDDGRPLAPTRLHARWSRVLQASELPGDLVFHVTRHTAGSRMLRAGVPIAEAAAILGDSPTTLLKVYAHAQVESARDKLSHMDARARKLGG